MIGCRAVLTVLSHRVVDGEMELLGANHPKTLLSRGNLAVTLMELGEVQAAKVRAAARATCPQTLPCPLLLRARGCDRCRRAATASAACRLAPCGCCGVFASRTSQR